MNNDSRSVPLSTILTMLLWSAAMVLVAIAIVVRLLGHDDAAFCCYGLSLLGLGFAGVSTGRCYVNRILRTVRALHAPGAELERPHSIR